MNREQTNVYKGLWKKNLKEPVKRRLSRLKKKFKQYFISILLGNGIGEQAKAILMPFPYMSEFHNFTRMGYPDFTQAKQKQTM